MSEAIPTRAEAIERTVYWLDVAATSTLNESRCNQALMFAQAYAAMAAAIPMEQPNELIEGWKKTAEHWKQEAADARAELDELHKDRPVKPLKIPIAK